MNSWTSNFTWKLKLEDPCLGDLFGHWTLRKLRQKRKHSTAICACMLWHKKPKWQRVCTRHFMGRQTWLYIRKHLNIFWLVENNILRICSPCLKKTFNSKYDFSLEKENIVLPKIQCNFFMSLFFWKSMKNTRLAFFILVRALLVGVIRIGLVLFLL